MNKELPQLASLKECTGCAACIDACHHNALSYVLESDGHYYVQLNKENCIRCKLCEHACPVVSHLQYSTSESSFFYAVWMKDLSIRKRSASGGAFSGIASYVLDKGGIVFGATNNPICEVKHIYIDKKEDLYKLQGSKYTQSNTSNSYKQVLSFLKQNRLVLFSGLGCQIAGLYSYLSNKKYPGRLITIDIICGGVPSKNLIKAFISGEPYKIKQIISFRTKENGWKSKGFLYNLKVEDTQGNIHDYSGKRNLITDGFCSELTNRYSCYNCNFTGIHRMSDYTIGDLWGDSEYPQEHSNGLSVLIVHNYFAKNLLKEELTKYLSFYKIEDTKTTIQHNPRLVNGKCYKKIMPERKYMTFLFNHLNYNIIKKIYAYDFGKFSPWMIYKIYRYILNKIFK